MNLTNTASSLRLAIVLISAFLVAGCVAKQGPVTMTEPASSKSAAVDSAYDMDSWLTIIGDDCRSFFDGCNNCFREPGKMAVCTRKACAVYQQPRCLDDEAGAASPPAAKRLDYACDGNNSFSVSYHESDRLPEDPEQLREIVLGLRSSVFEKDELLAEKDGHIDPWKAKYQQILEQFRLAQQRQFGKSGESAD